MTGSSFNSAMERIRLPTPGRPPCTVSFQSAAGCAECGLGVAEGPHAGKQAMSSPEDSEFLEGQQEHFLAV